MAMRIGSRKGVAWVEGERDVVVVLEGQCMRKRPLREIAGISRQSGIPPDSHREVIGRQLTYPGWQIRAMLIGKKLKLIGS